MVSQVTRALLDLRELLVRRDQWPQVNREMVDYKEQWVLLVHKEQLVHLEYKV